MAGLTPEDRKSSWTIIKGVFHPTLLKISLTIFFLALGFIILSDVFSAFHVIPCLIQPEPKAEFVKGMCTINPIAMKVNTIYLYHDSLDNLYQAIYLLCMALFIPYFLACLSLGMYDYYIPKNILKNRRNRGL